MHDAQRRRTSISKNRNHKEQSSLGSTPTHPLTAELPAQIEREQLARTGLNWNSILTLKKVTDRNSSAASPPRHSLGDVLPLRNPLRGQLSTVLAEKLLNTDARIRFQAAEALGEYGASAGHAVPALLQALQDSEKRVRYFAAQALGNIGLRPQMVAPALIRLIARELDTGPGSPGAAAGRALAKLGLRHPDTVLPILFSELGSDHNAVGAGIQLALLRIGSRNQELLRPYLEHAFEDSDSLEQTRIEEISMELNSL